MSDQSEQPDSDSARMLPASLVYVQVSRDFLRRYVEQSVRIDRPLSDTILGTSIMGQARTNGKIDVLFEDDRRRATVDVTFVGTVNSQTQGYNGPVVLYNDAQTQFQARKQLIFGSDGLHILPAVTSAQTYSNTTGIDSSLPGLRGRIARRVGWQRASEMRGQADAIAARHAEQRINRALDERVDRSAGAMRQVLALQAPQRTFLNDQAPPTIHFRSTATHIHMIVYRGDSTSEERKLFPPPLRGNPEIAVRIHREVVNRAIKKREARELIGNMLSKLQLRAVAQRSGAATVAAPAIPPTYDLGWSSDGQWLVITATSPGGASPLPLAGQ